jgi:DNA repair protein RecO (recombination protein O)
VPLLRTQGIVLRTRDLDERDRLVTLYTRDLGRVTAVAPGARRLRSRFAGVLELFTWGHAIGFERPGRDLIRLDHFDVRRSFRGVREDLPRLVHGSRMIESITRLTPERDPHRACFTLLAASLAALETGDASRVQLAFTLRLLDLLGHRPRLETCADCGAGVGNDGEAFDPAQGGVLCRACRPAGASLMPPRVLGVLRGLQRATWEARLRARIPAAVEREASLVLDVYLAVLVGGALRAPRVVAQLESSPPRSPASEGAGSRV